MSKPVVRFELTTVRLQIGCSTTELNRRGERILHERAHRCKSFFEESALTSANEFDMTHHALIDETVAVFAVGGVDETEAVFAASEASRDGSCVGVVVPPVLFCVVGQGDDADALSVDLEFSQGAGVCIAQGGGGIAVVDAYAVHAGCQESCLVDEMPGARARIQPCLMTLYGVFSMLADARGMQQDAA